MFDYIREQWNNYGMEILVGLSILFLLGAGIYHYMTGKKGTWSSSAIIIPQGLLKRSNISQSSYQGTPSPKKGDSAGERECRQVLESIFNRPFNKSRPSFLNNPVTGNVANLELDCFNPELKLAIEYNGIQHYQFNPFFHKNREHFLNQKYRDDMKSRMCKDNGITLITVPYTVTVDNIRSYLVSKLRSNGYEV
jgi:hypothetical protein